MVHEAVDVHRNWKVVLQICRAMNEQYLWAVCATCAVQAGEIDAAQESYAALSMIDRVMFLDKVKKLKSPAARNAMIAVLQGRVNEAEDILIQGGCIFRAIKMNVSMGRWDRALSIAKRTNKFVEVVAAYRTEFLKMMNMEEKDEAFRKLGPVEMSSVKKIIQQEEDRFSKTLNQGLAIINEYMDEMEKSGETVLSGEKAFKLHDTYGFPLEITEEILAERGYTADRDDFDVYMTRQKELGKSDAAKSDEAWKESEIDYLFDGETVFTGYEKAEDEGNVVSLFSDDKELDVLTAGESGNVILDRTPFYAKGGGQASDKGIIEGSGFKAEVTDVFKRKGTYAHKITVLEGEIKKNDSAKAKVDQVTRNNSARNHTCTHILHQALRDVLGEHVHQAGSAVDSKLLRFDFAHFEAMTAEQIQMVQDIVNEKINSFLPVSCVEMPIRDAQNSGALGLFEDKYGDMVRVVSVGDFSKELCGGIHVSNSGQIGPFKIISESGIAAGVRRIEAVTGAGLLELLNSKESTINEAAAMLKSKPNLLTEKLNGFIKENEELRSELESLKKQHMNEAAADIINEKINVNGIDLLTHIFEDMDMDDLRNIADDLRAKNDNIAIVFAAVNGPKVTLMVALSKDLVAKGYHAGNMIKEIAKAAGGGGGGKADMAQAGAKDKNKLPDAFKVAESLL